MADSHSSGLKTIKVSLKNEERLQTLHALLPYLSKFLDPNTIKKLYIKKFISSRALLEIFALSRQLQKMEKTTIRIGKFLNDTYDNESEFIVATAAQTTASIIYKQLTKNADDLDDRSFSPSLDGKKGDTRLYSVVNSNTTNDDDDSNGSLIPRKMSEHSWYSDDDGNFTGSEYSDDNSGEYDSDGAPKHKEQSDFPKSSDLTFANPKCNRESYHIKWDNTNQSFNVTSPIAKGFDYIELIDSDCHGDHFVPKPIINDHTSPMLRQNNNDFYSTGTSEKNQKLFRYKSDDDTDNPPKRDYRRLPSSVVKKSFV